MLRTLALLALLAPAPSSAAGNGCARRNNNSNPGMDCTYFAQDRLRLTRCTCSGVCRDRAINGSA